METGLTLRKERIPDMKNDIHPKWFDDALATCACGNSFTTGSTKQRLRVDLCSKCHPFYTGTQRIVDTAGQVERFRRRFGIREPQGE
jgi:large subunit ribosomal protein L31